uniref:GM09668p n=1 Tax=Drosophila melanogaster TaxID=7227 RepID=Q8T3L9_DROME|nr:GM09668p [Drosophila melanogaster]
MHNTLKQIVYLMAHSTATNDAQRM